MERFWQQCIFNYLRCDPEDHFFLLTESPLTPPENREYAAEIMFETFNVPGLYIAVQAVLALAASDTSGKVSFESRPFTWSGGEVEGLWKRRSSNKLLKALRLLCFLKRRIGLATDAGGSTMNVLNPMDAVGKSTLKAFDYATNLRRPSLIDNMFSLPRVFRAVQAWADWHSS